MTFHLMEILYSNKHKLRENSLISTVMERDRLPLYSNLKTQHSYGTFWRTKWTEKSDIKKRSKKRHQKALKAHQCAFNASSNTSVCFFFPFSRSYIYPLPRQVDSSIQREHGESIGILYLFKKYWLVIIKCF